MKLRPIKRKVPEVQAEPLVENPSRKKKANKLPPDIYKPMIAPVGFLVRETHNSKDPSKVIKQYIEISVKRLNDLSARPFVWISMYQESDFYTGYLKGKTTYLPLNKLDTLIEYLEDVSNKCADENIEDDGLEYEDAVKE